MGRLVAVLPVRQLGAVVVLTGLTLVGLSYARLVIADYQVHQEKSRLEGQVAALIQENDKLKSQIAYLQSDVAVEELARDELGWTRPGDTAVVILRDDGTPTPVGR